MSIESILNAFRKPSVRDEGGDPEGIATHPDELIGLNASMHILCKDVADILHKQYNGFLWAVMPDQRGGMIDILCLNFHDQYGYSIRVVEIQDSPQALRRIVTRGGGELLRRFRYPGTRYDMKLANNVPRDLAGKAIPDISDWKRSKARDQAEAELAVAEGRATVVQIGAETFLHVKTTK